MKTNRTIFTSVLFSVCINSFSWICGFWGAFFESSLGEDSILVSAFYILFRAIQFVGWMLIDWLNLPKTRPADSLLRDFIDFSVGLLMLIVNLVIWFLIGLVFFRCLDMIRDHPTIHRKMRKSDCLNSLGG